MFSQQKFDSKRDTAFRLDAMAEGGGVDKEKREEEAIHYILHIDLLYAFSKLVVPANHECQPLPPLSISASTNEAATGDGEHILEQLMKRLQLEQPQTQAAPPKVLDDFSLKGIADLLQKMLSTDNSTYTSSGMHTCNSASHCFAQTRTKSYCYDWSRNFYR